MFGIPFELLDHQNSDDINPFGLEIYLPSMLGAKQIEQVAEREAALSGIALVGAERNSAPPDGSLPPPFSADAPSTEEEDNNAKATGRPSLMTLPVEVRLQIYSWLLVGHPVHHAQLAPWYPTPSYSAYFLRAVLPTLSPYDDRMDAEIRIAGLGTTALVPDEEKERNETKTEEKGEDDEMTDGKGGKGKDAVGGPRLLSPHRTLAGIPASFLMSCRQAYAEARAIPFHENEFVFVNWFSSGIWAARAFTKALRPWQRDAMRHARLELLARDLTGPGLKEWQELCAFWGHGLVSLRLKVLIGGSILGPDSAVVGDGDGGPPPERVALYLFDGQEKEWTSAMRKMVLLRNVEVELVVADWSNNMKIEWCRILEGALNDGKGPGQDKVSVIGVEREPVKLEPERGNTSGKFA